MTNLTERARNKSLILLMNKLIIAKDEDSIELLKTMVENDVDSIKKTFEIIYNSLEPKIVNKIKRDVFHINLVDTKKEGLRQIKLVKLKELPDALYPNNIIVGYEKIGIFEGNPVVGECFYCGNLRTSTVQKIINENTFQTFNSIYQFTFID